MRLFWALALPGRVKDALAALQDELRPHAPEGAVRWVRPELFHLTLKFLGAVEDPAPVTEAVRAALAGAPPLELRLGAPGTFGGRRPRVVWAAVEGPGLEALQELARRVDAACAEAGFPAEERAFRAHVTLGRARQDRRRGRRRGPTVDLRPLGDAVRAWAPRGEAVGFSVEEVTLFASALAQDPDRSPVYTPEAVIPLRTG